MVLISCLLDVPLAFAPKARYALDELLRPLGLAPAFSTQNAGGETPDLYYGPDPDGSAARLALHFAPETAAFFERPRPLGPQRAGWLDWDGERWPVPVASADRSDAFGGLDLVASTFWWLSGWQEVATRERDVHGRFPYPASLQAALGTAHLPAVDAYRCALGERLKRLGIPVAPRVWGPDGKPWAVLLSHDVDRVRRRRLGALARGLAADTPIQAVRRALAPGNVDLAGLAALLQEGERRGGRATVFAKSGRTGRIDAPYRLGRAARAAFRRALAAGHEVGLHPSAFAMQHPGHLRAERDRLQRVTGSRLRLVRAHYLRFDPLRAPSELAAAGFEVDATLGFSAAPGYRRGTGRPFRLWDLRNDRPSGLWEVPLVVMDTTLLQHQQLSEDAAVAVARQVLDGARRTGGCAAILWHNRPLDEPAGRAAQMVYRAVLGAAQADGAALLSLSDALPHAGPSSPDRPAHYPGRRREP